MQIIIQSKDLALALRNVALRLSGILDQRLRSASKHLLTSAKQHLNSKFFNQKLPVKANSTYNVYEVECDTQSLSFGSKTYIYFFICFSHKTLSSSFSPWPLPVNLVLTSLLSAHKTDDLYARRKRSEEEFHFIAKKLCLCDKYDCSELI